MVFRFLKKPVAIVAVLLLSAVGVLCWGVYDIRRYARTPARPQAAPVLLTISPGDNMAVVGDRLAALGVVSCGWKFRLLARLRGDERRIKAGEYALSADMDPNRILSKLVQGKVTRYRLTVPEGFTMAQIADRVARRGLASRADFSQAASDPAFLARYGIPAETAEGYLFPETYFFPKGASAADIAAAMVVRFRAVFSDRLQKRASALGMSVHEVVTLAAMIEKETGAASERPLIASVFHNRLKRGMRLESDPTVIYGIDDFDGNLTRRHLAEKTPYNTYRIKGLPKGPIANPGKAAIMAALYPAETGYLFFVSKKNGTHHFSADIRTHNRAVRRYQLGR